MPFANEGTIDRVVRVVLGLALLYIALGGVVSGTMATVAMVAGALALGTGLIGWCALYSVLGISTR